MYLERITITSVKDDFGNIQYYVSMIEDITELKKLQEEIEYHAFHDMLTKLPNRYYFTRKVTEELKKGAHESAVVMLDLDRFKRINDTLGHASGDKLLQAVAERFSQTVKDRGFLSKLGGDEYIIFYPNISKYEVLQEADALLESLRRPFFMENQEFVIGASIGISLYPENGKDVETLLKTAEVALSNAKKFGRNHAQFFSNITGQHVFEQSSIENSLYKAIEQDQFELHYQPQLDIRSGSVVGAEVLVRWNHPERGMVPPMQFIPIAEESGLITQLDEIILRKACAQAVRWKQQGYPPLRLSVNISMFNFSKVDIVDRVNTIIKETGMDPTLLTIEVTESAMMNNPDMAKQTLLALHELGIRIALDDFGTGYSSMSYLKQLPFHFLKIDRSFIRDVTEDEKSAALVQTIIELSHSLNLQVVAEGVETEGQYHVLGKIGCNEAQGYWIGKPMPCVQFETEFITQRQHNGKR